MCLALPMRITAIEGSLATIAAEGLEQRASLTLVPQARVGDYVLVHAGFAINVLEEREAQETLDLLAELAEFAAAEPASEPDSEAASQFRPAAPDPAASHPAAPGEADDAG